MKGFDQSPNGMHAKTKYQTCVFIQNEAYFDLYVQDMFMNIHEKQRVLLKSYEWQ